MAEVDLHERVRVYRETGLNVSETARRLGIARPTLQASLRRALDAGLITEEDTHARNVASVMEVREARDKKALAFEEKKRKGDWRKKILKTLPDKPFRLKLFGDPHLDADGCDYQLFEDHFLDMGPGVYGVCVGDWFNNWVRALAGLYAEETTRPSDAWILLCHLMEQRGEFLLGACSGNHDDWSHGPIDPVSELMRRHNVSYRKGAIRLALWFPELKREITVAIRHKWKGNSIYSPGHGGKRAAMFGWRDHVTVGGHTHVDDFRYHVNPEDGFITHHYQVSAFKIFDDFPDVHGFMSHRVAPVVDLVIDPRRGDGDMDLVQHFYDPARADAYLRAISDG